eukprot:scaffold1253_cov245-Pinguiococcus_pyrenoidosus.AAC.5
MAISGSRFGSMPPRKSFAPPPVAAPADVVATQHLAGLLELRQGLPHWRADEHDDALLAILVAAVLERQPGDGNARADAGLAAQTHAGNGRQQAAGVLGGRRQQLHSVAAHGQQPHRVLGVHVTFRGGQEVRGVLLRVQARRSVVSVPHPLRVVQADHGGLRHVAHPTPLLLAGHHTSRSAEVTRALSARLRLQTTRFRAVAL